MKAGINNSDMQMKNRSIIIKHLMKVGGCSRAELARITGLTQAAITKIVADLIGYGLVEENGISKGEKGRRLIVLRLCTDKFYIIGIKFTRSRIVLGLFSMSGMMYDKCSFDTKDMSPENAIQTIEKEVARFRTTYNVIAIGVAVPGPFLRESGIIAKLTEKPGWDNFDVKQYFSYDRFKLPVFIEHDANAGALAIQYFDEISCDVIVHLLLCDGVGAGIVINGELLLGINGTAGEIGHMSIDMNGRKCECTEGARGCLEQYCSSISFLRDVKAELPGHPESSLFAERESMTVDDVFAAAQQGDAFAVEMTERVGVYIGVGVANIINIYNPGCIIISDVMSHGGEIMLRKIHETVSRRVIPALYEKVRIKYCCLKQDIVLLGAMATVIDNFLYNPFDFSDHLNLENN